ncbi:Geranylgeranyl transferase type-1 subunit beta [Pseudozyma hubeiensis]|nr:Geranylgeranyl transferase type-1 subunit beta [Pseudozyma hubeiensis]
MPNGIQSEELAPRLETKKHISFLLRCLRMLPQPYTSADDQRMTLGYFAISGLDLLHATDRISADERSELISWVYEQQLSTGGFRGSPSSTFSPSASSSTGTANIAMTYAALLILSILQDDFSRLDRKALLRFIAALQGENGGFAAEEQVVGGMVDRDPRFMYCAIAICSMLGEWEGVDVEAARRYLKGCQRYDGGFGASEVDEAHAGMTYCCVAGLHLLPQEKAVWERRDEALAWLVHRQVAPITPQLGSATNESHDDREASTSDSEDDDDEAELSGGFQGRPAKLPPDVCYSFWNGAALALLEQHDLIDSVADASYVLSAQSKVGGIAKIPGDHPDLLHTYLGMASLALHQSREAGAVERSNDQGGTGTGIAFGLKQLDAAYNCSLSAKAWIREHLTR